MLLYVLKSNIKKFLYLLGPGATEKSTMALIAMASVGERGCVSTSLKSLNSDNFEIFNLLVKKT